MMQFCKAALETSGAHLSKALGLLRRDGMKMESIGRVREM